MKLLLPDRKIWICLSWGFLLLLPGPGLAAERDDLIPSPEPPPLLPELSDTIEPEIRIVPREEELVEEYRINGKLYQLKVIPRVGPPYYLVDMDGDGEFERRFEGPVHSNMLIPSWVLLRW
jgi:hypothetical protein